MQGGNLNAFGLALVQGRRDEIAIIGKRNRDQLGQFGRVFGRNIIGIIAKIGPNLRLGGTCTHHADKVQQQAERHRRLPAGYLAIMDMVHWVAQPLFNRLLMPLRAELEIFVHGLWHDAQMQLLGAFGLAKGVKGNAVFGAIFQPILKREAIALGLGNLLAFFIEEHFVNQAFGRTPAKHARDLARLHAAVD